MSQSNGTPAATAAAQDNPTTEPKAIDVRDALVKDQQDELARLRAQLKEKDAALEQATVQRDGAAQELATTRAQRDVLQEQVVKAGAAERKKEGAGKPNHPFVTLSRQLDDAATSDMAREIKRKIRELADLELQGLIDLCDVGAMIQNNPRLKAAFLQAFRDDGFVLAASGDAAPAAQLPCVLENELQELQGGRKKYF